MVPPRSEANGAASKEDGEEEAAGESAKRVKEEAELALRQAQKARMEVQLQAWLARYLKLTF